MSEKPADSTTSADLPLPYADRPIASAPGHWVLARAGKRVLRPGGAAFMFFKFPVFTIIVH